MNWLSWPLASWFKTTWPSLNASSVRRGAGPATASADTVTVALGVKLVPATLPVSVYVPAFDTSVLSLGDGQITRTSGPLAPLAYVPGIVIGSLGSWPTLVVAVISGTPVSSGPADLALLAACMRDGSSAFASLPLATCGPASALRRMVATCWSVSASEYRRTSCS